MKFSYSFFSFLFFTALFPAPARADVSPERVYVVANSASADSLAIAEYYRKARAIPEANIIIIDAPDVPAVSRKVYQEKIANPIVERLAALGAVSAREISRDAETSRPSYLFVSHNVDFIVLCKLPFKILPGAKKNGFATDAASVDSELAASLMNVKKLAGTAANPLYKNFENPGLHKVYGVLRAARLDGANLSQMKALVDSALLAERAGVRGRAYIDKNKRGGGYKSGNDWLAAAGETLSRMHFDTTVDEADALMGYGTRFDAPAFYFGWYSASPQGYFCGPNFRAAAGAVGLHIYSFSASDLRKSGWANALVKAGFAQTCGNVYEPYLAGTHEPSSMMKAYEAGFCAGEAAYASARFLSWQWLVLGDPLYKPFAVSLEKQLERIDAGQIDGLSQYSVLREMNRRRAAGESPAKLADFAEKYIGKIPDAALVWRLVSEREAAGEKDAALKHALDLYSRAVWESAEFVGLSMELAGYLQKRGKSREAMGVYEGAAKTARGALLKFAVRRAEGLSKASGVRLSENLSSLKKKFDAEDAATREKAAREKAEREKKAAEKEAAARKK